MSAGEATVEVAEPGPRASSHAFPLPACPDSLLAAAFAAQLFRYDPAPAVVLDVSRAGPAGEPRWRRALELRTSAGTSCAELAAAAEALLREADGDAGRAGAEGVPAALSLAAAAAGLRLVSTEEPEARRAALLFDESRLGRAGAERLAGHLAELVAHLKDDPRTPIGKARLLPPGERRWLESVCDGAPREGALELVHRSFEARAAAAPGAVAARHRELALSYGELNARANRLARLLAARGIGAERPVAVLVEPSFDAPTALLAILKAGGVYVPLDPGYPPARLRSVLEDARPSVVVTRRRLKALLPADAPVLELDDLSALSEGLPEGDLGLEVRPEQTASVYFTSGTTGRPKGAAASQANLASYIRSARDRFGIGAGDVMPALARFTFSISMFELMSPLAAGGTLVLLDRDHVLDAERLSATLEEVTFFHAGPSLLRALLAHVKRRPGGLGAFRRVRHASSGGDMVPPDVLEDLKRVFAEAEIFVVYGCSEISCMGCAWPVPRDRAVERTFVGRPFDGVSVRVLDPSLNPVPAGVPGEICFAGDGVVKGYLNRPEATAEAFVLVEGRRFYRTGDVGRLAEDGLLEMLGRRDFQIKVRGMRVELGEVEHHLRSAPGVRDGVAAARRVGAEEKALVAYVVLEDGADLAAVRAHLAAQLPDYMVPSAYVRLERLPLNHNAKVDRRALPEPEASDRRALSAPAAREPRTPTERALAGLWTRLLALDRVGLDDRFFDLGGHSLLGVALIGEVERELGVALTGMEVLRETLEGQAALCDRRLGRPARTAGAGRAPEVEVDAFHFGPGRSLYGALACVPGRPPARDAVLVCAPPGQEGLRAQFVLRRLAERLASGGVPALRFDWFGTGDSLGEGPEATCARWREDVASARAELERRTGATRITAVGVRLGAALLCGAAERLDLAALVLWDPALDGARWLAESAALHERLVGGWRRLLRRSPPPAGAAAELLGLALSETCLRELRALRASAAPAGRPARVLRPGREADWTDLARVAFLLPDVGISSALETLAREAP